MRYKLDLKSDAPGVTEDSSDGTVVTALPFASGSGLHRESNSSTMATFKGFSEATTDYTTAVARGETFVFSFEVRDDQPQAVRLTDLYLSIKRHIKGPPDFELHAAVGSAAPIQVAAPTFGAEKELELSALTLAGLPDAQPGETVTFTMGFFGTTLESLSSVSLVEHPDLRPNMTFRLDADFVDATPVPEPLAAGSMAVFGLTLLRRQSTRLLSREARDEQRRLSAGV